MIKAGFIQPEQFLTSEWEGGKTTQLAIFPEGSSLKERDFLWRISSATFTARSSVFSDFSGYQRFLLPLVGNMRIIHEGRYARELAPYEADSFDGAWPTCSEQPPECRDYNFIVKKGSEASLQILREEGPVRIRPGRQYSLFSAGDAALRLGGSGEILLPGETLLLLETQEECFLHILRASSPAIFTSYQPSADRHL